jgi:hypothetical protein
MDSRGIIIMSINFPPIPIPIPNLSVLPGLRVQTRMQEFLIRDLRIPYIHTMSLQQ